MGARPRHQPHQKKQKTSLRCDTELMHMETQRNGKITTHVIYVYREICIGPQMRYTTRKDVQIVEKKGC